MPWTRISCRPVGPHSGTVSTDACELYAQLAHGTEGLFKLRDTLQEPKQGSSWHLKPEYSCDVILEDSLCAMQENDLQAAAGNPADHLAPSHIEEEEPYPKRMKASLQGEQQLP